MDDKPLELRDQLAINILNGILSREKDGGDVSNIMEYILLEKDHKMRHYGVNSAEKMVRISYAIADVMRKVRLTAFE